MRTNYRIREEAGIFYAIAEEAGTYKGAYKAGSREEAEEAMAEAKAIDAGLMPAEDSMYSWDY